MGYRCTNHPDQPAVLLITNLTDGSAVELCGPCVHPWATAISAATDPAGIPAEADPEHEGEGHDDGVHDEDAPVPYLPAEPAPAADPGPGIEPGEADDLTDLADLMTQARPHLAEAEDGAEQTTGATA